MMPTYLASASERVIFSNDFEGADWTTAKLSSDNIKVLYKAGIEQWRLSHEGSTKFIDPASGYPSDFRGTEAADPNSDVNTSYFLSSWPTKLSALEGKKVRATTNLPTITSTDPTAIANGAVNPGVPVTVDVRLRKPTNDTIRFYVTDKYMTNYTDSALAVSKPLCYVQLSSAGALSYTNEWKSVSTVATTSSTYTLTDNWVYVRISLDLTRQKVKLYTGKTLSTLTPWAGDDTKEFNFYANGASGSYSMSNTLAGLVFSGDANATGQLGADDIKVYYDSDSTSMPTAKVTLTGNPNIGAVLTGTYTEYADADGDLQSGSTYTWYRTSAQSATIVDTPEVISTGNIAPNESVQYTLTEADRGKCIRFSVTPKNDAATKNTGYAVFKGTAEQAGIFRSTLSIRNNTTAVTAIPAAGSSSMNAYLATVNTMNNSIPVTLVLARFSADGQLLDVKTYSTTVSSGSSQTSSGIRTQNVAPTSGLYMTVPATHDGEMLKAFALDSFGTLRPLLPATSI